ncbi:MAG: extracellular solute-binding protein [Clostridiales bacterium]|nr:extracellular solute-binding protein [Clostridiales bacterium]
MNRFIEKYASLIPILLLPVFISACSNGSIKEGSLEYTANQIIPPSESGALLAASKYEDTVWALYGNAENYTIISFNNDGQSMSSMRIEEPETISGFMMTYDGIIVLVAEINNALEVNKIGMDGTVLSTTQVNIKVAGINNSVECISAIAEPTGNIYIAWRSAGINGITCLSEDGTTLFTLSTNETIYGIALLDDNPIVLLNGNQLRNINQKEIAWSSPVDLNGSYKHIFSGDKGIAYLDDGQSLIEFDYNKKALTRLFTWTALGISSPVWMVKNNSVFIAYTYQDGVQAITVQERKDGEADTRKVITLATSNVGPIRKEIAEFNESNTEYRIEVKEYNDNNKDSLLTLMSTGNVPDIIFFTDDDLFTRAFSTPALGAKGYLADINEYIENDLELDQADFQSNIFSAAMEGGKLYEFPYSFWIDVIAGDAKTLGPEPGWTFEDLQETMKSINFDGYLFGPNMSRDTLLDLMLYYNMDEYVDWETGTCSFNSINFQNMLKFIEKYAPAAGEGSHDSEQKRIADGRQLLMRQRVGIPNYLQVFDFFFEDAVLKGFPTSSGCGNAIIYDRSFSISANTKYSDGVWSFVRQFYTYDYYLSHQESFDVFPINSKALEHTYQKSGEPFIIRVGSDGEEGAFKIEVGNTTENDIKRIRSLISVLDRVGRRDYNISDIVQEEANSYFTKQKTLQEATDLIQNRVQIYIDEQK